jgi:hypothetical protein
MDAKLFETLGQYAGIAGFSVGLILVLFRAILGKLTIAASSKQAYLLIRQMMLFTFLIGVLGIVAWFFSRQIVHQVTGHVLEKDSMKPIDGAAIIFSGRPESARSDQNGNFEVRLISEPLPAGVTPLYVSKDGYKVAELGVTMGQNIEVVLVPTSRTPGTPDSSSSADHDASSPTDSQKIIVSTEVYKSDQVASGACKDFGAFATLCTPDKPPGWTIAEQHFTLVGDRAGCAYGECLPLGSPTATKACYRFRTQGHDEECGHSGNTGIHYSQGILTAVWKHPE